MCMLISCMLQLYVDIHIAMQSAIVWLTSLTKGSNQKVSHASADCSFTF